MNLSVTTSTPGGALNYEQASAIGNVGERRVAEMLSSEAPGLGFQLISNLLLVDDHTTAQLDHVIVDRFGILVVETKNYHALIKGKSDDKFWTACYSGKHGKREQFLNPLRQNDRHREILHRVLGACGRSLPGGYVQSLVVFAGGNLAHLKVDDHDSMRVIPNREVVDYLRARAGDFQPNPGILDAEQVADLVSLLNGVNQALNPDAVALHAENVGRATRRFGIRLSGRPAAGHSSPSSPYGAGTIYHQGARYPDGSQHHTSTRRTGRDRALRDLLGSLFMLVVAFWILFGGGLAVVGGVGSYVASISSAVLSRTASPGAAPAPVPAPQAVGYDVNLALQRLGEASPGTIAKLTDAASPRLSSTNGMPTYTWQYIDKTANNAVSVGTISVTLDSGGQIVGVTGDK